jgi:diketogulonate reductase-like aldo/keto reductase
MIFVPTGLDYLDLYLIHFPIALKFVDPAVRYPPEWVHDPAVKNILQLRLGKLVAHANVARGSTRRPEFRGLCV